MNRTVKGDKTPRVKKVERIDLTERHFGRRAAAFLICLAVAVASISYGVYSLLNVEPGWITVDVGRSVKANCAGEFTFRYYLGKDGKATRSEQNAVIARYTRAAIDGYEIFNSWEEAEDVHNLWYLNHHPNEEVEVPAALYKAFSQLQQAGSRLAYLGPVYEIYQSLFFCQDDVQIAAFDPFQNEAVAEFCRTAAEFARDPASMELELLGDNRVRLSLSDAYLSFARENDVEAHLDLFWLKNAFVADFLADTMIEGGFVNGMLSSFDGFSRCLSPETSSSLPLYDRAEDRLLVAGQVDFSGVSAVVCLYGFPLVEREESLFYELRNGEVRLPYVDPSDGLSRAAADLMAACTADSGCAELLLQMVPFYIGEPLEPSSLKELKAAGISAAVIQDRTILYNDPALEFSHLYSGEGITYRSTLLQ